MERERERERKKERKKTKKIDHHNQIVIGWVKNIHPHLRAHESTSTHTYEYPRAQMPPQEERRDKLREEICNSEKDYVATVQTLIDVRSTRMEVEEQIFMKIVLFFYPLYH